MNVDAMVNHKLGRYRLQDVLGHGGMGIVHRAVDDRTGREVAVKIIHPRIALDGDVIDRFRREAGCLARCRDPHIAAVYEAGREDGIDFIAMELMADTLQKRMRCGAATPLEAVSVGAQILIGLAAAHRAGVVHRDVKPANIGLTHAGMLKLLDFGVASRLPLMDSGDGTTVPSWSAAVVGSLPYMAPEQLRGAPVDVRADVYGTGAVLYELTTGQRPFPAAMSGAALIDAVLNRRPHPPSHFNPAIGRGLDRVILRALAKKPESRYSSATAMMDALLRQCDERRREVHPSSSPASAYTETRVL